jgi:hypothetical protein
MRMAASWCQPLQLICVPVGAFIGAFFVSITVQSLS